MKKYILIILLTPFAAYAQNSFKAIVKNSETGTPLAGASVIIKKLKLGATANDVGFVALKNIPRGKYEITFSYSGFEEQDREITFPLKDTSRILEIDLKEQETSLGEVVVSSTRSSRTIKNIPTRVEVVSGDEIAEEGKMKPGNISKLLLESTGITSQQTSAVSGSKNIRIEGLYGTYTQMLRDGMPLYSGYSGGLSVMQIAPLDLAQVEFIKGSASTLYGGGAIAGLINLVSKTPQPKKDFSVMLNGTTAKGLDASTFYSKKFGKTGTTVFASYNYNGAYPAGNTGLTSIPKTSRFTINPKLFFYPNKNTSGFFGVNVSSENRYGGDLKVIEGKADSIHQYFEKNLTMRTSTQFNLEHRINDESRIQFKNSVGFFDRKILKPGTAFHGQQISSFSEFNYAHTNDKSEWITGANVWTEDFKTLDSTNLPYRLTTLGVFVQNTFTASRWLSLETGLRVDYNTPPPDNKLKGFFILPKVNALFQINEHWSSRIGGGLGYKMPSPFNEDAEEKGYEQILPVNLKTTAAERSYGLNGDVNFDTHIGDATLSLNQLLFYTRLNQPLILRGNEFVNANGFTDTKGGETNIKLAIDPWQFFIGYTYADTRQHFNDKVQWQPLAPKNVLITDFSYELEDNLRAGVEANYRSRQLLTNNSTGKGFVTFDLLFEKMWKHLSVFVNAENITDRRQTRWGAIYTGSITHPDFRDIYAPLDGVVVNSGVKLKL
ncbi:MAG: TonB-dependent receptor [Ginsengibacter sp.]